MSENQGTDQNWIIFRLAEIYLDYSEAEYKLGNEELARKYLNLVRERPSVHMPSVFLSGPDLLDAIHHERQIELCFEGHRFFDVRRWGIATHTANQPLRGVHIKKKPDGSFSYVYFTLQERKFNEENYLYPIPKYEMNKNKLLVQNPGY